MCYQSPVTSGEVGMGKGSSSVIKALALHAESPTFSLQALQVKLGETFV